MNLEELPRWDYNTAGLQVDADVVGQYLLLVVGPSGAGKTNAPAGSGLFS
jgi:hypothetical protein